MSYFGEGLPKGCCYSFPICCLLKTMRTADLFIWGVPSAKYIELVAAFKGRGGVRCLVAPDAG